MPSGRRWRAPATRARGATLYVSLEPCAHHGRTPPCVDAIIPAGIARVVTALEDPDPRVSGRGHARLRAAGITVTTGVLADEARRSHRGHIRRIRDGRPATTLKLARTADGFASRLDGPRLMITGEALNARVHLMRAHADAILVGVGTVLADDPLLTVRLPGLEERSPVRVILDSRLRTPPHAQVVTGAGAVPTWIVAADTAPVAAEQKLSATGVTVLRVGADDTGHLDVRQALGAAGGARHHPRLHRRGTLAGRLLRPARPSRRGRRLDQSRPARGARPARHRPRPAGGARHALPADRVGDGGGRPDGCLREGVSVI